MLLADVLRGLRAGFNEDQPRQDDGKFGSGGGSGGGSGSAPKDGGGVIFSFTLPVGD